jgi:hypothetical protein
MTILYTPISYSRRRRDWKCMRKKGKGVCGVGKYDDEK